MSSKPRFVLSDLLPQIPNASVQSSKVGKSSYLSLSPSGLSNDMKSYKKYFQVKHTYPESNVNMQDSPQNVHIYHQTLNVISAKHEEEKRQNTNAKMDTIAEVISRNNQHWNGVEIKQVPKGKKKKFTPFKVEQQPDEEKKEKTFEEELQEKLRQKYFARKEVDR